MDSAVVSDNGVGHSGYEFRGLICAKMEITA